VLLNQQFTSAALQDQINATPFSVVHLATHGQFSSNAENTFILAWDKPINVKELSGLLKQEQRMSASQLNCWYSALARRQRATTGRLWDWLV
jgi:CHAT domain-containing protein